MFEVEIFSPSDREYPPLRLTASALDAEAWGAIPYEGRPNQIYRRGALGVFGFAQHGPNGPIYTFTAGVLDPSSKHP